MSERYAHGYVNWRAVGTTNTANGAYSMAAGYANGANALANSQMQASLAHAHAAVVRDMVALAGPRPPRSRTSVIARMGFGGRT